MTLAATRMRSERAGIALPPFVPNYPYGAVTVEHPMPATPQDIEQLQALLRWARADRKNAGTREIALGDALERAIAYLKEPDERKNVVAFVLSALHQSMRRVSPGSNIWLTVDRDLHDWALGQIEQMFGGPFQPEPGKGRLS